MQIDQDSPKVSFPPPLVYLGTLLLGLAAERVAGPRGFGLDRPLLIAAGVVLALAGAAAMLAAAGLFRRAGTNLEPWRPATQVVTAGVYRWTRNPMYLGMVGIYAGLAVALDGPIALAMLPLVLILIQTQVIAREERYLEAKFGDEYRSYRTRVRRWL